MPAESDTGGHNALEVELLPNNEFCKNINDIVKIKMAKSCPLLCCLNGNGTLTVADVSEISASGRTIDGSYQDFAWEEVTVHNSLRGSPRLLTVGSESQLCVYEMGTEALALSSPPCTAESFLVKVQQKELGVSELASLRLLSFTDGKCFVLLNTCILVQLQWEEGPSEPEILSCCGLDLPPDDLDKAADYQTCMGTLLVLASTGHIYVFDSADGKQLAGVDLCPLASDQLAGLSGDDITAALPAFCLFQVSQDLSTAVAATSSNSALAVNLNEYFRRNPEHLLCRVAPTRPPLQPDTPADQDGLSSAEHSRAVLGTSFHSDRSWEAQLSSMYNKARAPLLPDPETAAPWFRNFPHLECQRGVAGVNPSQGAAALGGASVAFEVPEGAVPAMLSVSSFSVVLTFLSPGNGEAVVAFWDLQSQTVTYHRPSTPCAPVQRCANEQLSLLLKESGLSLLLFAASQEELLNRLMVFGSAGTVDSLCHLNDWGRCSIPIHALEAGLRNHQLDTVDFFLKSKENILHPYSLPEQSVTITTQTQLKNVRDLCPALDLLSAAIRDTHAETQSKQFSEQLLNITLTFLNTQVKKILSNTEDLDDSLQECMDILGKYIFDLRAFMKRFPWGRTVTDAPPPGPASPLGPDVCREEGWIHLSTEEVIERAVMTNEIARAQAHLRSVQSPEQGLGELRRAGLLLAFHCLTRRDLRQATALLRNMGFNVKKQLHSICLYTDDSDLRDFVVEELSKQNYLPEEEVKMVEFIKRVGRLCSEPATRCGSSLSGRRVLQMQQSDPRCGGLLESLLSEAEPPSPPALWSSVRLDWVRHWDPNTQATILLSRLQDPELNSCDPAVLWLYLTSLHDQARITRWIESLPPQDTDPTAPSLWPVLAAAVVNDNTACSSHARNQILDMLARKGVFVEAELSDFEQLLWRLSQAGGVMQAAVPVPHFRSPQGQDFHTCFIQHCLEHELRYLLHAYLRHYQLTPRNCPALADRSLYESHPWFEMLVRIQEITRNLSDPELVFQASLTNAQILTPGSQASISSMLLEGHSLLALSTIMFAPGGIDQVVSQRRGEGDPQWRVDLQLLKMALSPYPKLKSALFPQSSPRGTPPPDTTIYHLMQSLHPLDPSRLFGWQSANTLGPTDPSAELPHFSSPHLVSKYALVESLDFLYYLRHGRPSFAFGTFLVQQLATSNSLASQLRQAAEQAYSLGLLHFSTPSVAVACVCFCELLGASSLKLRVDLNALALILKHWSQSAEEDRQASLRDALADKGSKLVEAERRTAEELLVHLEDAVKDAVEKKDIGRSSYEAGKEWALAVQFCQLHDLPLSAVYPRDCAADAQWLHFLLFIQLHSYPPQQVRSLVSHFSPTLQAHLSLAFQHLQLRSQWEQEGGPGWQQTLPSEEASDPPRDLFQVLLRSQGQTSAWRYLLAEAMDQRCPTLTVLAACHQDAELLQCLCVWVLTSVDDVTAEEASAHIGESLRQHDWNLHDLSIIWKTLLKKRKIRPLIRGFQLFQRDCPLIHMLQMYELCYDCKNYPEAKKKLEAFQKCLLNLKSSSTQSPGGVPVQWAESQASVLLLGVLQQCATQYELRKLLQLLADVEHLLKSNGPDFKKLSQLSQILQDTPVPLSHCLLESSSTEVLQGECLSMLEQLQETGLFAQARQVAELAGLPIDGVVINELLQDLRSLKAKRQWERKEARVAFWRRCHEQFRSNGMGGEAASQFFLSQAQQSEPAPHSPAATELLCVQEKCLLLAMAGHWLSQLSPAPLAQLQDMEKRVWLCRVRQKVLLSAMEKESLFALPVMAAGDNSFEEAIKEFSFTKTAALDSPAHMSLEAPPPGEAEGAGGGAGADPAEERALTTLVGQLLDEGCINEASRVCRYFSLRHRDLTLVLYCRALAAGEVAVAQLQAELQGVLSAASSPDSEGLIKRSFPSSSSFGSLSSFVVVSHPEDEVVTQLQMLTDECHHGKSYCKQVLSLYELSKELKCAYTEISAEEPQTVLCKVLLSQQPDRYKKAQAFIAVQNLRPEAVAEIVSKAVVQGLLADAQDKEPAGKQIYCPSDGREAFLQLAKLCGDPNLVGTNLLDNISGIPLGELGCTVELLILAHDCFSLTCNMEGIMRVLQAARHLSHTHLAHSERYGLLVRLLTGIGRYNEMTYIFDLLSQNHRFEMLLRKKVESNTRLKTALLDYIKRCLPGDSEKHNMVALCFSMCREIGENHEGAARTQLKLIQSQAWAVTPELRNALTKVLTLLKDAAESYSKDSCVRQAVRCVKLAKLVTLQLHFLNHGLGQRVINLSPAELLDAVVALPRCYQAFIIAEAYDYTPDWAEVLYQKVLLKGDFSYLEEFKHHRQLQPSLFEEISKKFALSKPPTSASQNLKKLLKHCEDVYTYYKLAYDHEFFDIANMLLQDSKTSSYLKDKLAS
ncbi:spatacsin isoform X1 [Anguilla anguilla]|uniref:spatacsin isoform X1 n=1 Tax=Anguilla anguilla TaxID=7936 RepID=UPI0015B0B857|nr:spatacsin isoform X1 [Anguilla anguilla]